MSEPGAAARRDALERVERAVGLGRVHTSSTRSSVARRTMPRGVRRRRLTSPTTRACDAPRSCASAQRSGLVARRVAVGSLIRRAPRRARRTRGYSGSRLEHGAREQRGVPRALLLERPARRARRPGRQNASASRSPPPPGAAGPRQAGRFAGHVCISRERVATMGEARRRRNEQVDPRGKEQVVGIFEQVRNRQQRKTHPRARAAAAAARATPCDVDALRGPRRRVAGTTARRPRRAPIRPRTSNGPRRTQPSRRKLAAADRTASSSAARRRSRRGPAPPAPRRRRRRARAPTGDVLAAAPVESAATCAPAPRRRPRPRPRPCPKTRRPPAALRETSPPKPAAPSPPSPRRRRRPRPQPAAAAEADPLLCARATTRVTLSRPRAATRSASRTSGCAPCATRRRAGRRGRAVQGDGCPCSDACAGSCAAARLPHRDRGVRPRGPQPSARAARARGARRRRELHVQVRRRRAAVRALPPIRRALFRAITNRRLVYGSTLARLAEDAAITELNLAAAVNVKLDDLRALAASARAHARAASTSRRCYADGRARVLPRRRERRRRRRRRAAARRARRRRRSPRAAAGGAGAAARARRRAVSAPAAFEQSHTLLLERLEEPRARRSLGEAAARERLPVAHRAQPQRLQAAARRRLAQARRAARALRRLVELDLSGCHRVRDAAAAPCDGPASVGPAAAGAAN